ncbi:MAG: T9SS C-terminal target domain-containing protein [Chitinophagaceae bacterium]|nr:MAG: T9SS C-terminal target domain-containing protein [Chitinophagaceae bacterium]
MKHLPLLILLLIFSFQGVATTPEIIKNYDPSQTTLEAETYDNTTGFFTGHNDYGDEAFGEKYFFEDTEELVAIIAHHTGIEGSANRNAHYRITEVGSDGLPGQEIASVMIPVQDIPVDESAFLVNLDNAINITDSFFVIFDLGDYSHGFLHDKRVAVMHTPDGSRDEDDHVVYGRNVIRWHGHGGADWKDYRTENFQTYQPSVHFALFPVIMVEEATTFVSDIDQTSFNINLYPSPATERINVKFENEVPQSFRFEILDLQGKVMYRGEKQLDATEYNINISEYAAGNYILVVHTDSSSKGYQFVKK